MPRIRTKRTNGAQLRLAFQCLASGLLMALLTATTGFAARPITVAPGDIASKADFQAVLDTAPVGARIRLLGGLYDFSAEGPALRITRRVTIEAANRDDPPVLQGSGDFSGGGPGMNNGFVVFAQDFDISGVTISGLQLRDFARAIIISPFLDLSGNCEPIAGGVVRHLRIEGNHFESNARAIQGFGGGFEKFSITSNTFLDHPDRAINLWGRGGVCSGAGGASDGKVFGNAFESVRIGVLAVNIENLDVAGNDFHFPGAGFAAVVVLDSDTFGSPTHTADVRGNRIEGFDFGVLVQGPAETKNNRIANNTYVDSYLPVVLEGAATAYTISNESFSGSWSGIDIYLSPGVIDTKVIVTDPDTVLIDEGTGTKVVGSR